MDPAADLERPTTLSFTEVRCELIANRLATDFPWFPSRIALGSENCTEEGGREVLEVRIESDNLRIQKNERMFCSVISLSDPPVPPVLLVQFPRWQERVPTISFSARQTPGAIALLERGSSCGRQPHAARVSLHREARDPMAFASSRRGHDPAITFSAGVAMADRSPGWQFLRSAGQAAALAFVLLAIASQSGQLRDRRFRRRARP